VEAGRCLEAELPPRPLLAATHLVRTELERLREIDARAALSPERDVRRGSFVGG
jgi:hypothetical protein